MSLLAPLPTQDELEHPSPPGKELGSETQGALGFGWSSFIDEAEYVPELQWPTSIPTYHMMRSDSQVEALHLGTVQPVREFRWSIDPNSAPASLVEQAAADMGLPIRGHEDDDIPRGPRLFDFDAFLDDALLAPMYGHFHFEIVGEQDANAWHMLKLAPRHPRTIQQFMTDNVGDLIAVRQNIPGASAGTANWASLPPSIPSGKLLSFVWRREAGSHVGRSQLRSLYREWLVKDRVIRVAAINIERAGGVPFIEGPQGAMDAQLKDLGKLARSFKVAEGGGGAIPFGSKLHLVGGNVPDAISLLQYCDEAMARVWALMLVQLGTTATGNRALGGEFAIYAARAQRAMAKWVCRTVNNFLDRYTEWNLGPGATHAPVLHYEQAKPDGLSLQDMAALVDAGLLKVDPELESWIRSEGGLPEAPPAPTTPELGDLTPEEVALVQNSRTPPALPAPGQSAPAVHLPSPSVEPTVTQPTIASAFPTPLLASPVLSLPDRTLRRQPNAQEIRARMDLRAIDQKHQSVLATLQGLFATSVIPAQIGALSDQIVNTKAGTPRKTLTKAAMATLAAPADGQDDVLQHLTQAATDGAHAAAAELAAQGVNASIPDTGTLGKNVGDIATAVTSVAATSLTLAAQRKASSLVGGGRTPQDVASETVSYLQGLKHAYTLDQLQGAVTAAQNQGRVDVFNTVATGTGLRYFSSEILDQNTCDPCSSVDGTEYPDLSAAEQDYSGGGFVDCAGGPRCRGTLVAVSAEADMGA